MRRLLPFAIGLLLLSNPGGASALTLVRDGRPTACIIVRERAPASVYHAAGELRATLAKMSGASLPVYLVDEQGRSRGDLADARILVGSSTYTASLGLGIQDLKSDGFRVLCRGNLLALVGRDREGPPLEGFRHPFTLTESYNQELRLSAFGETGTLHAVSYFLESLGVRWFMPGELGEVVPRRPTVVVDETDVRREPAFENRHVFFGKLSTDLEGMRWYKRVGYGTRTVVNVNHSFYLLKEFRDTHPHYFALIDGRRDFDTTCQGHGSLCLSNEATVRRMADTARAFFDSHPDVEMFPVMPNDSYGRICECDQCRGQETPSRGEAGRFSDYVWGFVNRVAREVHQTHPDRLIACCSYGHYQSPPSHTGALSPNVAVMLCKQRRNYWDRAYTQAKNADVREWARRVQNIYLWEYYNLPNRAHTYYRHLYSWGYNLLGVPPFFFQATRDDLRFLSQQGVKGEFIEVDHPRCPGLVFPSLYVTAKLLWDPGLDVDALLDDYCDRSYGPGAQHMRRFFARAEALWMGPELRRVIYTRKETANLLLDDLWRAWERCEGVHRQRVALALEDVALFVRNLIVARPLLWPPEGGTRLPASTGQSLTPKQGLPVDAGRKHYLVGQYRSSAAGNLWLRMGSRSWRFFLGPSPRAWKMPAGEFHPQHRPTGPVWGDFSFQFCTPDQPGNLAMAWRSVAPGGSISWRTPRLVAGPRVVDVSGTALLPLRPAGKDRPSGRAVANVTIASLLTRRKLSQREIDAGVALTRNVQWRLGRHRQQLLERAFPATHCRLVVEARSSAELTARTGHAFSFRVTDTLCRTIVPRTDVPVALFPSSRWTSVPLASFVPDERQTVVLIPGKTAGLRLRNLSLVPDGERRGEVALRTHAERSGCASSHLKIRESGFCGLRLRRAPAVLHVTSLPQPNWLRQPESFAGLVLDYLRDGGRAHRVLLGLDAMGDSIADGRAVIDLPLPEIAPTIRMRLDGEGTGETCRRYLVDVAKHAPPGWRGELWIYVALAGTGDESTYMAVLREPGGGALDIVRGSGRFSRYAKLAVDAAEPLGLRLHGGDCYYALVELHENVTP